jgi:cytochrome c2
VGFSSFDIGKYKYMFERHQMRAKRKSTTAISLRLTSLLLVALMFLVAFACGGDEPAELVVMPTVIPEETSTSDSGDVEAGKKLFVSCATCHSTGTDKLVGPGLAGVYQRAATRTSLDADSYIEQSIRQPGAFIVPGFQGKMPSFSYLSDQDISNILAYLKTLN